MSLSLPRFFFEFKKLKSLNPNWVGGRLQCVEKTKNLIRLRVYGQGKALIVEKSSSSSLSSDGEIFHKLSSLSSGDLILLQFKPQDGSFKTKSLFVIEKLLDLKILFKAHVTENLEFKNREAKKMEKEPYHKIERKENGYEKDKRKGLRQKQKLSLLDSTKVTRIETWNKFIRVIRKHFTQKSFIETQTPSLVVSPGMEPTLKPFYLNLKWKHFMKKLFLPTSPEIHLKKLLCHDWTDIFEIKNCFRDEEFSKIHEPEFWMLEWYRAFSDLHQIEEDLKGLLFMLKKEGLILGALPKLQKMSLRELFRRHVDFDLKPSTRLSELRTKAKELNIRVLKTYEWNDVFYLLFLEKIEPFLSKEGSPYIIYDFPPLQSALSRLDEKGWAKRFEFYWKGLEIANAFDELTHLEEHKLRYKRDFMQRGKSSLSQSVKIPLDEDFLFALQNGMPPSGGIALGLDRLFLACQDLSQIREIRAFTIEDQFV